MSASARLVWRKSSYCSNGTCVEVARFGSQILVRDSKVKNGPILSFQRAEWDAFLKGALRGEFNTSPDRT
jgi:hypothetical protein